MIDTNIISYKYKNLPEYKSIEISNAEISSIVALEFLNNQSSSHINANYYIPSSTIQKGAFLSSQGLSQIEHAFGKDTSDSILFDFNEDVSSFKLYNNHSIANVINNKNLYLYSASIKYLSKSEKKKLLKKFNYILYNNITCSSLDDKSVIIAYDLLDKALTYKLLNLKDNFRNSWNDILILANAISSNKKLLTSDKELNRFASEIYKGHVQSINNMLEISFNNNDSIGLMPNTDSKGYVNRGWDYKMRK